MRVYEKINKIDKFFGLNKPFFYFFGFTCIKYLKKIIYKKVFWLCTKKSMNPKKINEILIFPI